MSITSELPVYAAMYDLQKYLYLTIRPFPKEYKYTLGESILDLGWKTLDCTVEANVLPNIEKAPAILEASAAFDQLKTRLRMAYELKLISHKRYTFIISKNEEIGKMLSGWLKWACALSPLSNGNKN
jgi:hypothetical protein